MLRHMMMPASCDGAYDACPSGMGVVQTELKDEQVAAIGAVHERSRYRWGSGPPPREAALSAAAHVLSPKAVTPVRRALPPAAFIDETDAVVTKNFKRTGQAGNLFSSRYLSADPEHAAPSLAS